MKETILIIMLIIGAIMCAADIINDRMNKGKFVSIDDLTDALSMIDYNVEVKIKYQSDEIERISKIDIGDWIDLRAAEDVEIKAGEFKLIPLGVAMELPEGFEACVVPRSSTYKNFGIIETNSMGIIDNSYCGDDDYWFFPAYATRDTKINKNDRICQFRLQECQPGIDFIEVGHLGNENRGGHGSTGIK